MGTPRERNLRRGMRPGGIPEVAAKLNERRAALLKLEEPIRNLFASVGICFTPQHWFKEGECPVPHGVLLSGLSEKRKIVERTREMAARGDRQQLQAKIDLFENLIQKISEYRGSLRAQPSQDIVLIREVDYIKDSCERILKELKEIQ